MSMKDKVTYTCGNCGAKTTKEYEYVSEIWDMTCPKCGSDDIWFNNFEQKDTDFDIVLGRGGCSQK